MRTVVSVCAHEIQQVIQQCVLFCLQGEFSKYVLDFRCWSFSFISTNCCLFAVHAYLLLDKQPFIISYLSSNFALVSHFVLTLPRPSCKHGTLFLSGFLVLFWRCVANYLCLLWSVLTYKTPSFRQIALELRFAFYNYCTYER